MSFSRPTLPSRAVSKVRRSMSASRTAARSLAGPEIANARVFAFFADGPAHLYQLEQWFGTLRALAQVVPTAIIVANFDTYRQISQRAGVPVALALATGDLERTIGSSDTRAVLYPNNHALNFRCLRYREPVHIFIGHGESDKGSSSSNQLRAYDYALAAGEASKRRMTGIRFFDTNERVIPVGRPQLDDIDPQPAPSAVRAWRGDTLPVVLYAPTWEGDRPSMAYGSAASHGRSLVKALLDDGGYHLIFRPHPSSGTVSQTYRTAVTEIAAAVERAGTQHYVDRTSYGWQIGFADYLITDVSAVAYDWLGRAKPMLITEPGSPDVHRENSDLLATIPGLTAARTADVVRELETSNRQNDPMNPVHERLATLRAAYFGDQTPGAATERFIAAVTRLARIDNEPDGSKADW